MPQSQRSSVTVPNDLEAFFMPFTANRAFKARPRLIARAKDMHYYTPENRPVLDAAAGLWCTNAGHNRDPIVQAIQAQAATLDFAPTFQFGHPRAFELASRIAALAPESLDHVFFCNSGSEAADTAMKIALAYWVAKGQGQRQRFVGRERGYHGVGFGGMAVGGLGNNRKAFGAMLPGVDHLPHTYNREQQAFSRGEPEWGAHLADELERIVAPARRHHHRGRDRRADGGLDRGAAGAEGLSAAAARDLRQVRHPADLRRGHHRLRAARPCLRGGTLRRGAGHDHLCQGRHSGSVPMGGVIVRDEIHDAFMHGPEHVIEFFHGYTYSAHPLACAAGLAALDLYREEDLFARAKKIEPTWYDAAMTLKGLPKVLDIRCVGITAAVDLASRPDAVGKRGYEAMERGFHDEGIMFRIVGDSIAVTPPLIVSESQMGEIFDKVGKVIKALN